MGRAMKGDRDPGDDTQEPAPSPLPPLLSSPPSPLLFSHPCPSSPVFSCPLLLLISFFPLLSSPHWRTSWTPLLVLTNKIKHFIRYHLTIHTPHRTHTSPYTHKTYIHTHTSPYTHLTIPHLTIHTRDTTHTQNT